MGNSFVPFDVSIVISHGQFHCGNRGHTQNTDFPWVKSYFPVGKRSSGTTAIVCFQSFTCSFHYIIELSRRATLALLSKITFIREIRSTQKFLLLELL